LLNQQPSINPAPVPVVSSNYLIPIIQWHLFGPRSVNPENSETVAVSGGSNIQSGAVEGKMVEKVASKGITRADPRISPLERLSIDVRDRSRT
jgi:hypothetical protein